MMKAEDDSKANGLDEYAKKRLQAREGKQKEADCGDSVCRQCADERVEYITVCNEKFS